MSKLRTLKSLVNERLTAAAEEIFGIFEITFEEYEGEVVRAKQEIERQRKLLDLVVNPEIKLCRLRADHLQPEKNRERETNGDDHEVSEPASDIEPARDGQLLSSDGSGTEMEDSEVHPEQQERSPSLSQEEPEPLHIKEELEELIQQQEEAASSSFILQPIKCENEEENTQWSQFTQTLKEESREGDPLPSTSSDQMNTEPDGEGQLLSSDWSETEMEDSDDYRKVNERLNSAAKEKLEFVKRTVKEYQGDIFHSKEINCQRQLLDLVLKPEKKLCKADHLQFPICEDEVHPEQDCGVSELARDKEPAGDGQLPASDGSGTETEDSEDYCKETREPQSGLNSLKSKTQKVQISSTSKKLKRSTESLHELKSTNHIPSTSFCKVCRECFPNSVSLMRHIGVHSHKCGLCEKHLEPTESLARHLQVKEQALERHVTIHTGDKPFGCTDCGKRFNQNENLTKHMMMNHTEEKPFSCSFCNKGFDHKSSLEVHMRVHTGEKPFSCSICNKRFGKKSNLNIHMRVHTGEKPFSCSICNKSFGQRSDLAKHMRVHTGEKPFSCSVCNKGFGKKSNLDIHTRVHAGEKPFSCPVCNKSFGMMSHLNMHMRVHSGEKPFSCSICNKSFGKKSHLNIHMIVHTGEKPFSCSICNNSFGRMSTLKRHMRGHTGDKPFGCTECGKRFNRKDHLTEHTTSHTRRNPFAAPFEIKD